MAKEGYDKGYDDGYDNGWNDGVNAMENCTNCADNIPYRCDICGGPLCKRCKLAIPTCENCNDQVKSKDERPYDIHRG